jgi:hypothetical protein
VKRFLRRAQASVGGAGIGEEEAVARGEQVVFERDSSTVKLLGRRILLGTATSNWKVLPVVGVFDEVRRVSF